MKALEQLSATQDRIIAQGLEWKRRAELAEQQLAEMRAERRRWIVQLLKARDEFAKSDHAEAWHQLYQIASPDFTKMEPWKEFEEEAALAPTSQPSRGKCETCGGEGFFALGNVACPKCKGTGDCAQPERQGADNGVFGRTDLPQVMVYTAQIKRDQGHDCELGWHQMVMFADHQRALDSMRPSPPQDDIVAGLRKHAADLRSSRVHVLYKHGDDGAALIDRAIAALGEKGKT